MNNNSSSQDSGPIRFKTNLTFTSITPMKKDDHLCIGFIKMLAQEFLVLRRRAITKKDEVSVSCLDTIIAGITELTSSIEASDDTTSTHKPLQFTAPAWRIFSALAKSPEDPRLMRNAGMHYLMEWNMPSAALNHFKRALTLSGSEDETLPVLIKVATAALKRKNSLNGQVFPPNVVRFDEGVDETGRN